MKMYFTNFPFTPVLGLPSPKHHVLEKQHFNGASDQHYKGKRKKKKH